MASTALDNREQELDMVAEMIEKVQQLALLTGSLAGLQCGIVNAYH